MTLLLHAGPMQAGLLPHRFGSIRFLRHNGADLLRPGPAEPTDPRQTACFALVPFCNRIERGGFTFNGQTVELGPAEPGEPHALHGIGWREPWVVEHASTAEATLVLHHAPTTWPWPFTATQHVVLEAHGLTVTLTLINTGTTPMPAGAGLHPYFPRTSTTTLSFAAAGNWTAGATGIADQWHSTPREGATPLTPLDDCFGGWPGTLVIQGPNILLQADTPCLHLYTPGGEDYFCAEPVSHSPNAINSPSAAPMHTLAPGACLHVTMRIKAMP